MKTLLKTLLFGKPIEPNYPPIKVGWKTIGTQPASFNEWAYHIANQLNTNKHERKHTAYRPANRRPQKSL